MQPSRTGQRTPKSSHNGAILGLHMRFGKVCSCWMMFLSGAELTVSAASSRVFRTSFQGMTGRGIANGTHYKWRRSRPSWQSDWCIYRVIQHSHMSCNCSVSTYYVSRYCVILRASLHRITPLSLQTQRLCPPG